MGELSAKARLILDGGIYKLSYTQGGKQQKVSIKNEKDLSLMGARKITDEVNEIVTTQFSFHTLQIMKQMNSDVERAGYSGRIIQYQTISIELSAKIMYPEKYSELMLAESQQIHNVAPKPLEVLNIGCTAAGKTLFILNAILSKKERQNFRPSLTSIKETTACMIAYHLNADDDYVTESGKYRVSVKLKSAEELKDDIILLIVESFDEYVETIRNEALDDKEICTIREDAIIAAEHRLELNYDKTFGLGTRDDNHELALEIENLVNRVMIERYGNSKSIKKLIDEDPEYVIKQLRTDFSNDRQTLGNGEIPTIAYQYANENDFLKVVDKIKHLLCIDLELFKNSYNQDANTGDTLEIRGLTEGADTLDCISHIFGNKRKQNKEKFYVIEPLIKYAEFFFYVQDFKGVGREIILSDSVGINQGQKDSKRLKEIAFRRVQISLAERKPDIVIYHTKLEGKDDYLVDIVKNLNMEGYGKDVYIVAGRLDTILDDQLKKDDMSLDEMDEEYFDEFIDEVKTGYIEKDCVSISSIVAGKYFLCDKSNGFSRDYLRRYLPNVILEEIMKTHDDMSLEGIVLNDVSFMGLMQKYRVWDTVYAEYLGEITNMIPLNYSSMRWNTLQKAIETLYADGWGHDVLYPSLKMRSIIAEVLSRKDIHDDFEQLYGPNADEIKKEFIQKATELVHIVLITEFRKFMTILLLMRNDDSLRTNLGLTMTDDRKYNLQKLYRHCLEQNGYHGEYSIKIVFHVAWLRTIGLISQAPK